MGRLSKRVVKGVVMKVLIAVVVMVLSLAASATEMEVSVPTDQKAKYTVIEVGGKWPHRIAITKRVGPSGVSYSKRLYDCVNNDFKYLGDGGTLAEMIKSKPDPNMSPLVLHSISYYIGLEACKR